MRKHFFIAILVLISLFTFIVFQYVTSHDGRLHVIFCDVGQGDAILITSPANKYVLIDGGPDKSVLSCLSRHLPFWERHIAVMLLTHPHADHHNGLYFVAEQYDVDVFATERLSNKTAGFRVFRQILSEKRIPQRFVATGDTWQFADGLQIEIAGPTEDFLQLTDPDGIITDSAESGSLITEVVYGSVSIFLTGDAPVEELQEVAQSRGAPIDLLQSPHHGSKTGINQEILEILQPKLITISVGKDNKYGHPSKSVLDLYKQFSIPVLRTDQVGDIEVVSDGNSFWIEK